MFMYVSASPSLRYSERTVQVKRTFYTPSSLLPSFALGNPSPFSG